MTEINIFMFCSGFALCFILALTYILLKVNVDSGVPKARNTIPPPPERVKQVPLKMREVDARLLSCLQFMDEVILASPKVEDDRETIFNACVKYNKERGESANPIEMFHRYHGYVQDREKGYIFLAI